MTELSIQHVATIDPDHVQETLCSGHFNIHVSGNLATLTFTHWRPKTGPLFGERKVELEAVIRARIVTSVANLTALRDALDAVIKDPKQPHMTGGRPH
jgi:hypothetical protein